MTIVRTHNAENIVLVTKPELATRFVGYVRALMARYIRLRQELSHGHHMDPYDVKWTLSSRARTDRHVADVAVGSPRVTLGPWWSDSTG